MSDFELSFELKQHTPIIHFQSEQHGATLRATELKPKFELSFELKQHTPIIHFQSEQHGATLRATELKPKFDKFLIEYFKRENIPYNNFLIKDTNALNYKVKIFADNNENRIIDLEDSKPSAYFGNMKLNDEEKILILCKRIKIILDNLNDESKVGKIKELIILLSKSFDKASNKIDKEFSSKLEVFFIKLETIFSDEEIEDIKKIRIFLYKIKLILEELISNIDNIRNKDVSIKNKEKKESYTKLINEIKKFNPTSDINVLDKIDTVFKYKIRGIINDSIIKVKFIFFKSELKKHIENNFPVFLIMTNFGTRKNKGFGCFYIKDTVKYEPMEILKKNKNKFIYGKYTNTTSLKISEKVPTIYALMKSGLNFPDTKNNGNNKSYYKSFLFQYMLNKSPKIVNEKKFIKENFFDPNIRISKEKTDTNPRKYVRALLGVSDGIDFKDPKHKKDQRVGKIYYKNINIERFESPILFKIIDDTMFIIPKDIEEDVFNAEFSFVQNNIKHIIKVPQKEEFDIFDFVYEFAKYFNTLEISKTNNFFDKAIQSAKTTFIGVNNDK